MKGIMFSLLQQMAEDGGCSGDAWELVIEFAAAESLLGHVSSGLPYSRPLSAHALSYEAPAEAMVRCLSQEGPSRIAPTEATGLKEDCAWLLEGTEDLELSCGLTPSPAFGTGFAAEAFLSPGALLSIWESELEFDWTEEEASDEWQPTVSPYKPDRKKN